ncbi:hypothetical protein ACFPA8_00285 [Streptomyces ovatisporus]|uniref:Secreted protein n=1 Tax=Streptomyces ovatisporus TaxID=1128682 RepID=A0ABV9A0S4_9ACTN
MRKLREAAVVAAMVGSVSILGAGIATAHEPPAVNCEQDASNTDLDLNFAGTVTVAGSDGGDADASATQQICGIGNEENTNTAGTAVGGIGTGVLAPAAPEI